MESIAKKLVAALAVGFVLLASAHSPAQTTAACAGRSEAQCATVKACRWASPAGQPTVARAGCYRACTADRECATPARCREVRVDPCPDGDCTHAPTTARLCLE